MRRTAMVVGLGVVLTLASGPAWAQQQRGRGGFGFFGRGAGGVFLASNEAVRKELKVSDQQKQAIEDLASEQRQSFQGTQNASPEEQRAQFQKAGEKARAKLKGILNADQQKRLEQIRLQQTGLAAVAEPEIAKQLNLTSDQEKQVKELVEKARAERRQSLGSGQGGDRAEAAARFAKAREEQEAKLSAVLAADQKEQWKKMLGEKFDLSQLRRGGPRRRNDA